MADVIRVFASLEGQVNEIMRNDFQLTTCLWLQSKDTFNYGTVVSYATLYYDNTFTLTDYNG